MAFVRLYCIAILLIGTVATLNAASAPPAAAVPAGDEWRREFEAVCSRTDNAMEMPTEELRSLVERCDRIRPQIEDLEPSARKVYLKRLQLCRDLYRYVLGAREKGATGP